MVNRINLILKAKNITARQFAEEIGIQPSGMSHILSGRNRPSLDFIMKVINRYPEIDINWLMFGKGEMMSPYIPNVHSSQVMSETSSADVKSSEQQTLFPELDLFSEIEKKSDDDDQKHQGSVDIAHQTTSSEVVKGQRDENGVFYNVKTIDLENKNVERKKIAKVVILYSDHSFSEYYPENN